MAIGEDGKKQPINLRALNICALSDMVVKLSLPLVGGKPVEIINSISAGIPPVLADEDRIRQVLHNLVGNAIKFTASGVIELSSRVIPPDDETGESGIVEISVSDTGIGVPAEYRESIFEVYSQVDTGDTRSYSGTGLGLAIAKQIIELHGGTIRVAPGMECGSVFTFSLPVSETLTAEDAGEVIIESMNDMSAGVGMVNNHASAAGPGDDAFAGNPVLLVVDDDPVNIRLLQNCLEPRNCVVKTATDGAGALEILERDGTIDLVLLDIMMPVMSGYEVCRRIRMRRSPEELPVIMLTAKNMMSDIDAAFDAGANDYIVKPFHLSELLVRSASMLKLRRVKKSAASGISIHSRGTVHSFTFSEIIYVTSSAKNIIIHAVDADTELPVMMKDIADRLPPDMFVRIHKCHIINIRFIRSLNHVISGRYRVLLRDEDDTYLPVGPAFLE